MFDQTTWNNACNALLTATDMVCVNIDNRTIIKLNNVRTAVANNGGSGTGVFQYIETNYARQFYLEEEPQTLMSASIINRDQSKVKSF